MIPIGDSPVRSGKPPVINYLLIIANFIVFFYELSLSQPALDAFTNQYGLVPSVIEQGRNLSTLITSMFIHGGWLHILGNMVFLWVFGDNIEDVLGHLGYLVFYFIGGLAASFAHILFNLGSTIPSIGASGAIAAVMGAYILMFPHAYVRVLYFLGIFFGVTRVGAVLFLGIWIAMQFLSGIASLGVPTAQTSGVAVWAHVGGFLFGIIVGIIFRGAARRYWAQPGQY